MKWFPVSTTNAIRTMTAGRGNLYIAADDPNERAQRASLILRDVAYRLHAELEFRRSRTTTPPNTPRCFADGHPGAMRQSALSRLPRIRGALSPDRCERRQSSACCGARRRPRLDAPRHGFSNPADPAPDLLPRAPQARRARPQRRRGAGMILQALYDYYQRKQRDPAPPAGCRPDGFEDKEILFIIELDADGALLGLKDTRQLEGKKQVAARFRAARREEDIGRRRQSAMGYRRVRRRHRQQGQTRAHRSAAGGISRAYRKALPPRTTLPFAPCWPFSAATRC